MLGIEVSLPLFGELQELTFVAVRWVNAIWSVLERTRSVPASSAAPSFRSRPMSLISSAGGGSASTHYSPPPPESTPQSIPFTSSVGHPLYTTDDAIITTPAGLAAPIVQRGSRRLASGVQRARSLRRVASEADLSESGGLPSDFTRSEPNLHEPPLTADAARQSRVSRDFTFARGAAPPAIETSLSPDPTASPPPSYSSPVLSRDEEMPCLATAMTHIGSTAYDTPASRVITAQDMPSTPSMATAPQFSIPASMFTAMPMSPTHVPPPSATTDRTIMPGDMSSGQFGTATTSFAPPFATARGSVYSTARGSLMSPFETAEDRASRVSTRPESRGSVSTYDTAPPPVPSRDSHHGHASIPPSLPSIPSEPSSRGSSPMRYQLHDRPMSTSYVNDQPVVSVTEPRSTWVTAAEMEGTSAYHTAQEPATVYQTATSNRSTLYSMARPYPPSRDSENVSFRSDMQEQAETGTHVSELTTDVDIIADLERRSSAGSAWTKSTRGKGRDRRSRSGRTPFGTANENTLYETARETLYTTAPGWETENTYMVTAADTRLSVLFHWRSRLS